MNKKRRIAVFNEKEKLTEVLKRLNEIKDKVDSLELEEENSFDSIPENLQDSLRGQDSQDAIDELSEAVENLENAIENLDNII